MKCFPPALGLLALLAVAAILSPAMAAQPDVVANQQSSIGRIALMLRQQQYREALAASDAAIAKTPADPRLWTLRGMADAGLGDRGRALISYEAALKHAPKYLPALEGAAQLQYQQGGDAARPYLTRILSLRPDDPTAHAMLAVLDYRREDCTQAISHFEAAQPVIAGHAVALGQYGVCLATTHEYARAVSVFRSALALDPSASATRYNLALSQWEEGMLPEAIATLEPLLNAPSKDERVLLLGAALYEANKETQPAIDLLRSAVLANPKDPDPYLQFAYLTYDHGSPKIGIDYLTAGLTQLPQEARFYLVRGVLYSQIGEFGKAMQDFQEANRLDPRLSFVDVSMGVVESQEHNSAAALARFKDAARRHPEQGLTQYLLAEALSHEDPPDEEAVMEAANRALRDDPRLTAAHDLLANLYLHRGQKALAIQQSDAALEVDPNDREALYHLVLALRGTDRKGEIPELLARMNHIQDQGHRPQPRLFRLSEVPAPFHKSLIYN